MAEMNFLTEEFRQNAERIITNAGYELVELKCSVRPFLLFQFFVDHAGGITVNECAQLSRVLQEWLDRTYPDIPSYRLEVSSPGVDRLLKTEQDFRRNLHRELVVEYRSSQGLKKIIGKLCHVENGILQIESEMQKETIPISSIMNAKIKLKWSV